VLALCLVTLPAYSSSLTAGFALDSKVLLLEDPRIRLATAENISLILQRSYWWPYADSNLYRPVTTLSYLFNWAVLGNQGEAFGYHAINLFLHIANVLLVYALGLRLSRLFWPSLFVAAVWAVHPLTTEAVTNLVGRADLLAALGVLGALFAYTRSSETRERTSSWWFAAAIVAATVAIFSKESGVAVVGVIVLHDVLFRLDQMPARRLTWRWLAFLLPVFAYLYQRSTVVLAGLPPEPFVDNPLVSSDLLTARLTALSIVGRYLWLMVWPSRLSSDYSYAQIPMASGTVGDWAGWIATAAIISATVVLFVVSRRNITPGAPRRSTRSGGSPPEGGDVGALACFALAFSCLTFLPASNLLFVTGTIMAERVMYLPSVGLIACIVMLWYAGAERLRLSRLVPIALCVIVSACAVRTVVRNRDWDDDLALWTSAVRTAPASFKTHQGLADALYEADRERRNLDQVIAESDLSVRILEPVPDALNVPMVFRRAAGYHLENGDLLRDLTSSTAASGSTAAYERSIRLVDRYLAILQAASPSQNVRASNRDAEKARELSEAYVMLATGYSRLRNTEKTLDAARRAQALQPLNSIPYRVIGAALIDAKASDDAAAWLLAGFTVTGDPELRQGAIDFYRAGGDPNGCAIKSGDNGPVLDPSCETVRRHLCAATRLAIQIHRDTARADLANQLESGALPAYGCK